ncbi:MAG: TolC family protein [Thermodesulfobacteriota bacterium]
MKPFYILIAAIGMTGILFPAAGTGMDGTLHKDKEHPIPSIGHDTNPLRLEDLISKALSDSPAIQAARAKFEASRELIDPASALPDPELEFSIEENLRSVSSPDFVKSELRLKQAIPYPGKRGIKGKIARAESDAEYAAVIDTRREVIKEIRSLYAELYAIDSEVAALGIARELIKLLEATAAARYASGQGEQEGQIKAQLETSRIMERLEDIASERKEIAAQLSRAMGNPKQDSIGRVTALGEKGFTLDFLSRAEEKALLNAPSLHAGKAQLLAAELRLEAAKLDLRPDFFTGIGIALNAENESEAGLSLGMTLPVWQKTKQKPLVRAAAARLDEARKNLEAVQNSIQAEIVRYTARWNRDQEQIRRYQDAILPQTGAALDSARASYLSGRADFSVVIEDYNLWLDARTRLARREADRFITWAGLEFLIEPYPIRTQKEETP